MCLRMQRSLLPPPHTLTASGMCVKIGPCCLAEEELGGLGRTGERTVIAPAHLELSLATSSLHLALLGA